MRGVEMLGVLRQGEKMVLIPRRRELSGRLVIDRPAVEEAVWPRDGWPTRPCLRCRDAGLRCFRRPQHRAALMRHMRGRPAIWLAALHLYLGRHM